MSRRRRKHRHLKNRRKCPQLSYTTPLFLAELDCPVNCADLAPTRTLNRGRFVARYMRLGRTAMSGSGFRAVVPWPQAVSRESCCRGRRPNPKSSRTSRILNLQKPEAGTIDVPAVLRQPALIVQKRLDVGQTMLHQYKGSLTQNSIGSDMTFFYAEMYIYI